MGCGNQIGRRALALAVGDRFGIRRAAVRGYRRTGEVGLPMSLTITVVNSRTCKPLRQAAVDVWQCNASGVWAGDGLPPALGSSYLMFSAVRAVVRA